MDYNTGRDKLIMPEYGRHVQKMIEQVMTIEDKEERAEQMRAVVQVMGILNPQLRDSPDFKHKLWDHVQIIAGFDTEIDSPYPKLEREEYDLKPDPINRESTPIKASCYGRNIENMINLVSEQDEDQKNEMIRLLAIYMRQQYLIWNKDSVSEETIFKDMERLSEGKLKVPEGIHLSAISEDASFNRPAMFTNQNKKQNNFKKGKNKKRKNN